MLLANAPVNGANRFPIILAMNGVIDAEIPSITFVIAKNTFVPNKLAFPKAGAANLINSLATLNVPLIIVPKNLVNLAIVFNKKGNLGRILNVKRPMTFRKPPRTNLMILPQIKNLKVTQSHYLNQ